MKKYFQASCRVALAAMAFVGLSSALAFQKPAQPALPTQGQKTWTDWGVLRSTTFTTREGQPMWLLEKLDGTGAPIIYVTTQPGTSLNGLVGQTMTLYGTLAVRNDENIRMQYIVAEQFKTNTPR